MVVGLGGGNRHCRADRLTRERGRGVLDSRRPGPIRINTDAAGEPVPLAFRAQVVQTAQATLRYD
jgi:hypothetical protein